MAMFFMSWFQYLKSVRWAKLVFCLAPLLVFLFVSFIFNLNPFELVPLKSDEVAWYMQIQSVIEYGAPLGYTGYNETHAAMGTFGPWGGFIVYLMSLFGKVFGWHPYSPLFLNVFYMMVANLVFLLLARPQRRAALRLALLNVLLFVNIRYMFSGMSECTRFSMAVVLAALFCFLFSEANRDRKSYVIVLSVIAPVVLFIFLNSYILFSFLLPVYGYVVFKYLAPKRFRLLIFALFCIVMPVFITGTCLFVQMKTAAPYSSNTIRIYLSQPSFSAFLRSILSTVAENSECANPWFVFRNVRKDYGFLSGYLWAYYFLLAIVVTRFLYHFKKSRKMDGLNLLVAYALSVFVITFIVLYSTKSSWTYVRGLNVALVFSLYIICLLKWQKMHRILFCLGLALFIPFIAVMNRNVGIQRLARHAHGGGYGLFAKYSSIFSSRLSVAQSADKWENTIAIYGTMFNFYCAVPSGFSWNYILDGHLVSKPRYIFADRDCRLVFSGYRISYSDELISIYEKEASVSRRGVN